ncbi:MAG: hypothetical protein WB992_18570 [Bryobacteraceae bacterium]
MLASSPGSHTFQFKARYADGVPDAAPLRKTLNVVAWGGPGLNGSLDAPASGSVQTGTVTVRGWGLDSGAKTTSVAVFMDGLNFGTLGLFTQRTDVCVTAGNANWNSSPDCKNSSYIGFSGTYSIAGLAVGYHAICIVISSANGSVSFGHAFVTTSDLAGQWIRRA